MATTKTIEINKEKALKTYAAGTAVEKKAMEKLLGKELFQPKTSTRPKTYQDACRVLKRNPLKSIPFPKPNDSYERGMNAMGVMLIFAEALQGDFEPDYGNTNQPKYYPYFQYQGKKAGFGFSDMYFNFGSSAATVGSRLCFPDAETAKYFGTQILKVINQFLNK